MKKFLSPYISISEKFNSIGWVEGRLELKGKFPGIVIFTIGYNYHYMVKINGVLRSDYYGHFSTIEDAKKEADKIAAKYYEFLTQERFDKLNILV